MVSLSLSTSTTLKLFVILLSRALWASCRRSWFVASHSSIFSWSSHIIMAADEARETMPEAARASLPEDADAIRAGGVEPTHGRTREEQKAWFKQMSANFAAKALAAKAAEKPAVAAKAAEKPAAAVIADAPCATVPAPPIDVSEVQPPPSDDDASDLLQQLTLAGGDVASLANLAAGESRTELTQALKGLGFKGLQTRVRLEKELKAFHGQRRE